MLYTMSFMNPFIAVCTRSSDRPSEAGSTRMRSLFPDPGGGTTNSYSLENSGTLANEIFNRRGKNVDPTEMKHVIGPTENTAIHP